MSNGYYLDIYASDNEDDPEAGTVKGTKRFNILSLLPTPKPVGKFERRGDGSGRMPRQRRIIMEVVFEHFSWNEWPTTEYHSMDDLTTLRFMLSQPYIQLVTSDFPWATITPGSLNYPNGPHPLTQAEGYLGKRYSWRGVDSEAVNERNGWIEYSAEFEMYFPDYLEQPSLDLSAADNYNYGVQANQGGG